MRRLREGFAQVLQGGQPFVVLVLACGALGCGGSDVADPTKSSADSSHIGTRSPLASGKFPEIARQMEGLGLDPATLTAIELPNRPKPVILARIPTDTAVAEWERLHARAGEGWSPVLSADTDPDQIWETIEESSPAPAEVLEAARRLTLPTWLDAARATAFEDPARQREFWTLRERDYRAAKRPPDDRDPEVVRSVDRARTDLLIVPTPNSWEIPAWLDWWGGVNYGLDPAQHVMVLRSWKERYGADLLALGLSTMELRLTTPVADRPTAEAVAREQYLVCPDAIEQGVGTMGALVASVEDARYWWFWWD